MSNATSMNLSEGTDKPVTKSEWMNEHYKPDLVSVIIPTYNRSEMLKVTLDSVKKSDYRPLEILVVDDGSIDSTLTMLEQWKVSNEEDGLELNFFSQSNSGAPSARNIGLKMSKGEFIQFFDSDDYMAPWKIINQVDALKRNPRAYFVWSSFVFSRSQDLNFTQNCDGETFKLAKAEATPGMVVRGLFRRSACDLIGPWNEALERYQDWEYSVRYISLNLKSICNEDIGFAAVQHTGERVDDINRNEIKVIQCLEEAAGAAYAQIGDKACLGARVKIAKKYSEAMLRAMALQGGHEPEIFIKKIRNLLPLFNKTRLKNEVAFLLFRIYGPGFLKALA